MQHRIRHRGFSLIEVMVALGVMGVAGYFLASMLKSGSMGQKTLLAQDDARVLTESMTNLLANPNACEYTFGDGAPAAQGAQTFPKLSPSVSANPVNGTVLPYGGTAVTQIYDSNMNPQFVVGNAYGNRGVKLNGITIGGGILQAGAYPKDPKTQQQLWTPGTGSPPTTGTAFVQVDWLQTGSTGNQGTGPQHLYRYFMVFVANINAANQITTCTAQVGGGAATNLGNGTPDFLAMWANPATTLTNSNLFQDASGNVGVGTTTPKAVLDVNGGIHPGPASKGGSCAGSAEGTFAYDMTNHTPVYCGSGGSWVAMYGGPIWQCTCSNFNVWTLLSNSNQTNNYCSGNGAGAVGPSTGFWKCVQIQ